MLMCMDRDQDVVNVMRAAGAAVETLGPRTWRLAVPGGVVFEGRFVDDAWLVLEPVMRPVSLAGPAGSAGAWRLLAQHPGIVGGGKFVVAAAQPTAMLRVEIAVLEETSLADRIAHACAGLVEASTMTGEDSREGGRGGVSPHPVYSAALSDDLRTRLHDTCWPCIERDSAAVFMELDVPHGFYEARVEQTLHDESRLAVEVADCTAWPPASRQALAVLLLTACGVVRMARAVVGESSGRQIAQWEVAFSFPPTANELTHALAALSLACRVSAAEIKLLEDEEIANRFLSAQGWSL